MGRAFRPTCPPGSSCDKLEHLVDLFGCILLWECAESAPRLRQGEGPQHAFVAAGDAANMSMHESPEAIWCCA